MRITFLIGSLTMGGAERQLTLLANSLNNRGHLVNIIVYYKGGQLQNELERNNIPVHVLGRSGRWDIFHFLWKLIKTYKTLHPEILHSYMGANIFSVLIKLYVPTTKIVWGIRASEIELKNYHWTQKISQFLESKLSRFSDLIISNSKAGYDNIIKNGYPPEKTIIIPNGIDTEYFKPDEQLRLKTRAQLGINDSEILIGIVARLDPMKDHKTFLESAALVAKSSIKVRFICVGDGPAEYKKELQQHAEALSLNNKIIWTGSYSNMAEIYNGLDIICSASSYGEGFSNVIAEAMSCNKPCIATDVGDAKYIVDDTGIIVPVKSPEILSNAIMDLINNDKYWVKDFQRSRIENNFSLNMLTRKTEEALENLMQ